VVLVMKLIRQLLSKLSSIVDCTGEGIDATEYIDRVARELQIIIRNEDAEGFQTLGDLCQFAREQRREQGKPLDDQEIWTTVLTITSEEFGVAASELHPGVRYVEDLCC
jgi:hypothetical protein